MPKQSVDILLVNGWLVAMDAAMQVLPTGAVAGRGNKIVGVGPTAEIEAKYEAATLIDCTDCIISPGLINAHTHAAMT
ncbi:MAG TPA: amidohydrolase, partial [Anaerolineae bacterium]|nr:amidohydrolase [Anaerolineae bacterium]